MIGVIALAVALVIAVASTVVAVIALRKAKAAQSLADLAVNYTIMSRKDSTPPKPPTGPGTPVSSPARLRLVRGAA